ncbi:MAG: hypothetical protein AAB383_06115 [Patescibacteria group bacterium]
MASQNPQIDALLKELKSLKSAKNFDQLLLRSQEALMAFPDEADFLDYLHYAQEHYVKDKLDSQIVDQLIEKKDYAALAAVYQKLLTILPDSRDLKHRLQKARVKIQEAHRDELKTFYANAEKQIKAMVLNGQYESAVTACHEILEQDPENKTFIHLLVKADTLLEKEMNDLLEIYYKETLPVLYKEYDAKHEHFIKI